MNNTNRLIKESKDLSSNASLSIVSYYFDLYLINILIQNDYEDKEYIGSLLDKMEAFKGDNDVDNTSGLQQVIKFCIIIYKKNIDLSKSVLTGDTSINVSELIHSVWLNIDLIMCLDNSFDVDDTESKELLEKFSGTEKLKTLKLLLKRLLELSKQQVTQSNELDDEELLNEQMSRFEKTDGENIPKDSAFDEEEDEHTKQESEPDFEEDNVEENAPDFEVTDDTSPPALSKTSHSVSSFQLPTPPKNEDTDDKKLITHNLNLSSSASDYDSSEISQIITTQETIDKMVKLAKIGIQCIQYEDLEIAKQNFEQLVAMLKEEVSKA